MHYAIWDVKDMGQQMGYRSLEWNWPKEAMNTYLGSNSCGDKLFKKGYWLPVSQVNSELNS